MQFTQLLSSLCMDTNLTFFEVLIIRMGTTEKNLGQQQLFAYLKICTTRPDPGD